MEENDTHVVTYSANDMTDVIEGATLLAESNGMTISLPLSEV